MHNHDQIMEPDEMARIIKDQSIRCNLTTACHHWFFHIYFPHYVKYKTAQFHKELFELTEKTEHKTVVIEAFRGSGKTTIMGTSFAIWSILGIQQKKFVLIIAKTESQARQYLANIKLELESNHLLKSDLGPFEEPNDEWRAVSIVLPKYKARITVASIDNSIRGIKHGAHRPDLIIADDLEDLDIVKTQESRDKMFNWLMGDIIPLGDKDTRLIVIGTKLHNDSIIMRLKKAILEGTMSGIAKAYPFLRDGVALWPEKFSTQSDIETLRKSVPSIEAWEREYMLNIVSTSDQVIRREWIKYYDSLPSENQYRYAASGVDPAISEDQDRDCTAIVSGKIYGRKKNLKIYVMPNPINERIDSLKALDTIKAISNGLGQGLPSTVWVESVQYQKAIIQQLVADGYPAKEYRPYGADKRARLSIISAHIQSGTVLFPKHGAERLIEQLVGFGIERHDDLSDALCILVSGIIAQESNIPKGYHELFTEPMLTSSYHEGLPHMGEKRLGVSIAERGQQHSAIVLRSDNAAEIVYHDITNNIDTVARKIVEVALRYGVPLSDEHVFFNKDDRGRMLAEAVQRYAYGHYILNKYQYRQKYGIFMHETDINNLFTDLWAKGYSKIAGWIQQGGRLIGQHKFDDLLYIIYTDQSGKRKIIDREGLQDDGIDTSVPDALALTIAKEKRVLIRPPEERYRELWNDPEEYDEGLQFPDIGI